MRSGWKYYHAEAQSELSLLDLASEFCAISLSEHQSGRSAAEETYQSLLTLDDRMAAWPLTLSGKYAICRTETGDSSGLYWNDTYDCHVAAVVWNRYRRVRIKTNQQIIHHARLHTKTNQGTLRELWATSTIAKLSEDICYSVPFLLGGGRGFRVTKGHGGNITIYGGTSVVVPLLLAAREGGVSPAMHDWITNQLGKISQDVGVGLVHTARTLQ